jgi:mannose-1-phosphate guanylyltransferase/mannose-6-phosphate isomerase
MPKQLLHILGDKSMLAMTVDRVVSLVPEEQIWTVTTRSQAGEIKREFSNQGYTKIRILEEPAGRNTAAAIGLAAVQILRDDPEGIMIVLPADHYIEDKARFLDLLSVGREVAQAKWLVTLGITPTHPETGYGYIRRGKSIDLFGPNDLEVEAFKVAQFTEKPNPEVAEEYMRAGDYFWNSGIFLWQANHFLEEMQNFLPEHHKGLFEVVEALGDPKPDLERAKEIYESFEAISVDYGIMESSKRVAMLSAEVGWSDVGSWAALKGIMENNKDGNVIKGNVLTVDTHRSVLYAQDRLIAAMGLEDMVVVDTDDALLICPEKESQHVKGIVGQLIKEGREEAVTHRKVPKPWGAYKVLDRGEAYQLKWLDVFPGERLSLQSHEHRAEHWIVVAGRATVTLDGRIFTVEQGEHIHIPRQSTHRIENQGSEKLRMIEIQTGDYLGEDDITRYEDDYGRSS